MPTNNNTPEIHVTPTDIKGNEVVRISRLNDQGQWEHCFSMFSDLKDYFGAGLEFIPENVANKATDLSSDDNTHYPTTQAVKTYVDTAVVGLLNDRGNYDASVNAFPSTGGSGTAGAIMKGDLWYISVAGTLGGTNVLPGYSIRALADSPGTTAANWDILNVGFGYVPENAANKDTDGTLAANSDTRYASQKATKTYVDAGLSGKLNTTDTTDAVTEGTTNKYFTTARVLATALTGYAAAGSRVAVAATDTVLQAFGKVGKYLSDLATVAFTGSYSDLTGTPTALPPNGSAGGDLTGTYPNPTIKANVALGGNPTTTTQTSGDNSTKIATTAYVNTAVAGYSPSLTSTHIGYGDGSNLLTGDSNFVRYSFGVGLQDNANYLNLFIGGIDVGAGGDGVAGNNFNTGGENLAIGPTSMNLINEALQNTGIGYFALQQLVSGSYNVALGFAAGSNAIGSDSTFIGAGTGASVGGVGSNGSIALGSNATTTMDHQFVIGGASGYDMVPNWQINGIDYVMPSSGAAGALTNDGAGNLSWANLNGITYGNAVGGGDPNEVLFIDPNGNLGSDIGMQYNAFATNNYASGFFLAGNAGSLPLFSVTTGVTAEGFNKVSIGDTTGGFSGYMNGTVIDFEDGEYTTSFQNDWIARGDINGTQIYISDNDLNVQVTIGTLGTVGYFQVQDQLGNPCLSIDMGILSFGMGDLGNVNHGTQFIVNDSTQQILLNGGMVFHENQIAGGDTTYNVLPNDYYIDLYESGNDLTINLPDVTTIPAGTTYVISDAVGAAISFNITIQPAGGQTISTYSNLVLASNFGSATIHSDGSSNWIVTATK